MTVITGPVVDSAGQPANGYLYVEQWYRSELNGTLVTDNPARGLAIDGELFQDDGITPLDVPATPLGGGTRFIEDFRPFTRQIVRSVEIPETGPVQYATLHEVIAPVGSSTFIIPGNLRSFIEKADGVADALLEAQAAAAEARDAADDAEAVEAVTVSGGTITGDNLVLTRTDGSTVNAGDVRGPRGPQGLPGPGAANNDDATEALVKTPTTKTASALVKNFAPANADTRGEFLVPVAGGGTYHHNEDTKAGSATSATYKTKHPVYVDDSRPTVTLANSTDLPKVGGAANPQPLTMAQALIGPDGVIRQARFGGSLTVTLQPGESITSDPIENLTLVRGTDVFALSFVSAPVAAGWRAGYLITNNAVVNDGLGRVYGADVTATGAGIAGASDTGAFYAHCPVAISGRATVPARAVSLMMDSIGFGAGATGGDYLRSFALDALNGGRVPYVQFSRSGGTLDQAGNSPTPGMIALAGSLSDDCILELATNDFSNGKTAAQVEAASLAMAIQLKAAGVKRVWRTTVTPRSSGTAGAQTPHSSTAARQSFNAWARSGAPVDPVTLVQVAPGTLGALLAGQPGHPFAGVLDLAALVEDGITGTWKAALYGDGLHPNDAGHTALQAGVRADLFGGSTTSPKNYLSTWFPKKIYSSIAGAQLANGRFYFVPFHVADASVRIDQLVMNASNAGSAEGVVRAAIYSADAKGRPLTLVADLGTKTPTYGATYWTIPTPITLQPGRYFMALISQGAPATPPSYLSGTGADPLVTGDTAWVVPASNAYILNGVADGAAPATIGNTIYSTAAPFMQVRAVG